MICFYSNEYPFDKVFVGMTDFRYGKKVTVGKVGIVAKLR